MIQQCVTKKKQENLSLKMADSSFTGKIRETKKNNNKVFRPQCHIIARTTDAIDRGESSVSYPASSSSATLHEALEATLVPLWRPRRCAFSTAHDDKLQPPPRCCVY